MKKISNYIEFIDIINHNLNKMNISLKQNIKISSLSGFVLTLIYFWIVIILRLNDYITIFIPIITILIIQYYIFFEFNKTDTLKIKIKKFIISLFCFSLTAFLSFIIQFAIALALMSASFGGINGA